MISDNIRKCFLYLAAKGNLQPVLEKPCNVQPGHLLFLHLHLQDLLPLLPHQHLLHLLPGAAHQADCQLHLHRGRCHLQSKPGGVVVDSLDNLEVAKVDKLDKSLAGSLKLDLPYSGSVAVAILWPESQIRYFAIVWRDSFTVLLNTLQYIASPQLANQLWPDRRQ